MTHQLSASLMSSATTYSLPSSMSYPSSLLPIATNSTNHQLVPSPTTAVSVSSTSYHQQSIPSHQLPPTPNSLVTMMGPNSGSSNSASEQLPSVEISVSSVSPAQQTHPQAQHQPQATAQQQSSSPPPWNAVPLGGETVSARLTASPLPSSSLQPVVAHLHSSHQHQAFSNHYGQAFQQPRSGPHQPFYNWYN